ncbi:flagellar assembly protein FliH [Psychrobacillus insolitus]|uniref:flagellar assembly protein FliH n=1 Tax=Psychrobacillus insolitus TaxID=1461 RepID=UPI001FE6211E|nr:flagellar assembly protein FliH [Psychrobacillus insolitus]
MSKIIRNAHMIESNEKLKPIQIRDLYVSEEIEVDYSYSHEEISRERNKMLSEVEIEITTKKTQLSSDISETKVYIESQLREWEEQKNSFQQLAYDEGFSQGLEEGRNKAVSDMQELLSRANKVIETAYETADSYLQHQEHVILELGIRTAERIIGIKLENDDQLFLSIVKRGLKEAREMKKIKLYISPTYFTLVSSSREELASIFPVDVPFMIFVDEDIQATDCYIETNHGRIVVGIDEQLQELRIKLNGILDSME